MFLMAMKEPTSEILDDSLLRGGQVSAETLREQGVKAD
jgi:hypothetical protein